MPEFSGQPLQLLRHNIPSVVNNCFLVDLRKSDYVGDAPVVSRVLPSASSKKNNYVTGVCRYMYAMYVLITRAVHLYILNKNNKEKFFGFF